MAIDLLKEIEWISVQDRLPKVSHEGHRSAIVLVKDMDSRGRSYPWVAHLWEDGDYPYPSYNPVWYVKNPQQDGKNYVWLNPYDSIEINSKITHWAEIFDNKKSRND